MEAVYRYRKRQLDWDKTMVIFKRVMRRAKILGLILTFVSLILLNFYCLVNESWKIH